MTANDNFVKALARAAKAARTEFTCKGCKTVMPLEEVSGTASMCDECEYEQDVALSERDDWEDPAQTWERERNEAWQDRYDMWRREY